MKSRSFAAIALLTGGAALAGLPAVSGCESDRRDRESGARRGRQPTTRSFPISDTLNHSGCSSTASLLHGRCGPDFTSGVTLFDDYIGGAGRHSPSYAGFLRHIYLLPLLSCSRRKSATSAHGDLRSGPARSIDRLALWNEESSGIGRLDLFWSSDGVNVLLAGVGARSDRPGMPGQLWRRTRSPSRLRTPGSFGLKCRIARRTTAIPTSVRRACADRRSGLRRRRRPLLPPYPSQRHWRCSASAWRASASADATAAADPIVVAPTRKPRPGGAFCWVADCGGRLGPPTPQHP